MSKQNPFAHASIRAAVLAGQDAGSFNNWTQLLAACQPVSGKSIIDLSCGACKFLAAAKAAGATVHGVDCCAEMLAEAPEDIPTENSFLEDYSIPASTYDVIVTGGALHLVSDPDVASLFQRAYDALSSGGVFVASSIVYSSSFGASTLTWSGVPVSVYRRSSASLIQQLEALGFTAALFNHNGRVSILRAVKP